MCEQLGDGKVCNATCCIIISWSPTLAENRDVLEHHYTAKTQLVHCIWDTYKGDQERGMLNQQPTLDIAHSNWYQVWAQLNNIESHLIQSAQDNIAVLSNLHCWESNAELLEFIDFHLAENKYLFCVAERVEGGVSSLNSMHRESQDANECPMSTLLPAGIIPVVYLHQISSSRE